MQPNPIPGQTNDARDRRHEAAVLARVLWLHPTHLTERELLLSLFAEGAEVDAYERATATSPPMASCAERESRSSRPWRRSRPGNPAMTGAAEMPWTPDPDAEEGLSARLGENVRLPRAHVHISQEELASRADVHRTQISMFESGQRMPLLGAAVKLAAALEVDLATLLDGITYRPRFFSAAHGEFEISSRPLFELSGGADRSEGGAGR